MQLYSWLLFTLILAVNCPILMKEPSGVNSNIDILDVLRSGIHRTPEEICQYNIVFYEYVYRKVIVIHSIYSFDTHF